MILEIYRGQVFLDDRPIEPELLPYLIELRGQKYKGNAEPGVATEESPYILIESENVTINASWFGELPLFYFRARDYFVLSSSYPRLLCRLKKKQLDSLDFDRIGILESMIFDSPLRSRTLFKGIHKVIPGKQTKISTATLEATEATRFVLPFDKGDSRANNSLLDQASEILDGLSAQLASLDGRVLLPLSGGRDSRLLGCLMKESNVPYSAIVFGPKESTEPYLARVVAKKLNVPLRHLELRDKFYKTYGDEVTWLTGGLSSHMHCHLYAVLSANSVNWAHIVHGYLGDVYAGASQPEHARNYSMSVDQALHSYSKQFIEKYWIWNKISAEDRDGINNDLVEIMDENNQKNLPCHFEEYVHNVDRQFSLIANVFSPIEKLGNIVRPFASKEYAIFFNSLPFDLRQNRKLFVEASNRLFPEMSKIGTQDQIHDKRSLIGKCETQFDSLIRKVSYASLLVTNGKFVIRNPKAGERHRELLLTELKADFEVALDEASDLLGIDLAPLKANNIKNRYQTISQYRILSLYSVLRSGRSKGVGITGRCT